MAAPQASSRLELLQARFQQKQLQEKEQKLLQLYDQQQQRAYQVVQRGSAGSNNPHHGSTVTTVTRSSSSTHTTSTAHGGKVRQMFDERRQTGVKGIDRSYPLEPLDNKPRKQPNGLASQRNGNFTVSRQSVTVKRVARADVNSNLNGGKPVISYHEEVTRESFGSPNREDKDEFGSENHLSRYANGNGEVRIEEILDSSDGGRMPGKFHLTEYEEGTKQRVRNDLEGEEFPEDLLVDVSDKLPKRAAARKLSQAEARLERFKNANAKRTTPPRNTTTTFTKKRSEPLHPAKSISSNTHANRSRLSELISEKSTRRSPTPTSTVILTITKRNSSRSPSTESRRSVSSIEKARSRLSSPELIRSVKEEIDKPEFFCVESEKSATTYNAKPTISWTNKTKRPVTALNSGTKIRSAELIRKKRSDHPEFFCKENDRSATTYSLKPRPIGSKNPTTGTKSIGRKSRENDSQDGSSRPKYFCREGDKSATTMSIDAVDTRVQSVLRPERIVRRPGGSAQSVSGNCKATSGTDVKSKPRITRLSESEKQVYRGARTSPPFFGPDSEKSATTMTVVPETIRKSRAITSPETKKREDSRSKKLCFNHTSPSLSLKDLGKESPRSGSPKYFDGETERKASGTDIDTKAPVRRSPSPEKLIEKRESSPEFFCRESEKSATTISLKPVVSNGSIGGRSKSPRSEQQKAMPRNGCPTGSDRKSVNQYQSTRRMSKSPENSAPFGNRKGGTCRKGSAHVLRSIDLIRAVINHQDQTGNASNLSRKQRALDKKRGSIKSDESDGVSLGKVGYRSSVSGNNSRPRTPANSGKLSTPASSPRSLSSAEGVAEIQEITLSHRYVHRDKVDDTEKEAGDGDAGRVVGRTYSKSCSQKGSRTSKNSRSDSPATYSTGKSCKKRGSLLKPNIFVPMCTRTREQGSTSRRRSSSDSKSSCEAGRTVSLRQITRNKSQVERSPRASPPPRPTSSSSIGKLPFSLTNRRASGDSLKREITAERETSGSPRQTSPSLTARLRNREWPINSSRSIFGENPKKCRSGKSSTASSAPISPSSGRRLPQNSSRSDAADTLRSTDLVRRAMDARDEKGSRKISLGGNKNQGDRESAGKSTEDHNTVDTKAEAFEEEKHKVVKKDKAVYPGLADEKLKNLSTSSREIEKMNIRITDSTGKGNESADYVRTDSVESALRRFDSIGAESTRTFTLGSFSQSNLHTAEEHETMLTESKAKKESEEERISLKGLDQVKPASPIRIKSVSSKPMLRKTTISLSKTPKSAPKGTLHSSVAKISRSPDIRSKKKFAKARNSIEMVRFSAKSQSPGCKRRLFQDSDSGEETATKSAASKNTIIQKQVSSQKLSQDSSEPDSSVSPKQLRSIEDIRKSMKSSSSSNASFSRLSIVRRKESQAKPAIAYKVRQSPTTLKLESRSGPISSVYRSRATSCWKSGASSPGGKDLFLKDRTPLSRITKSPSPEPASRKVTEAVRTGTGRRSVPPSPSKSPETATRAPPESKGTRRPVAAGSKRSTFATAKKSPDATDGHEENGLLPQEPVAEGKQRDDIHTRKADAFVIDFDEPPAREREPAQARKPLPRKQSAEKLTSPTTPARPPSSVSSTSSGSPHGSKSKMSGRAKSKSMLNAASTSRTSASMKNTGSYNAADNLMACKTCGRHFATDRVRLHEEICTKTAQKKRKQFDAMLFRVRGTELEPFVKKGLIKKNDSRTSKAEVKSDWRKKHEDFINAIRSAKQVQAHLAAGGKLSDLPPPPPSDYSDYIQCPHCGRKFNQSAAERHIPKCQNMLHNKPIQSRPPKPRR